MAKNGNNNPQNQGFGGFGAPGGFGSADGFGGAGPADFSGGAPQQGAPVGGFGAPGASDFSGGGSAAGFGGAKDVQNRGKTHLDGGRLALALALALVGALASIALYRVAAIPMILRIGLAALLSAGLPLAGTMIFTAVSSKRSHQLQKGGMVLLPVALALIFGVSCLGQWIYSLGEVERVIKVDDYLFVIDDSGSMNASDPKTLRLSSMRQLLESMDDTRRAGLVCFSDTITATVALAPATRQQVDTILNATNLQSAGMTSMGEALNKALEMCDDPSRATMLVLLTDGVSTDYVARDAIADLCSQKNAVICAIGLSEQVDEGMLTDLCERTGGKFTSAENADSLVNSYNNITVVRYDRDLLGVRTGAAHGSVPLALLRVFVWLLVGALSGLTMFIAIRSDANHGFQLIGAAGGGLLLGLLLELLNALRDNHPGSRIVLLVLLGVALLWLRGELQKRDLPIFAGTQQTEKGSREFSAVELSDEDLAKKKVTIDTHDNEFRR